MKKRQVFLISALAFLLGWFIREEQEKRSRLSPEQALEKAKEAFKKEAPISGSWIYMIPEDIKLYGITYSGYHGGITRQTDNTSVQSNFFVDKETSAVFCIDQHADEHEITEIDGLNLPV